MWLLAQASANLERGVARPVAASPALSDVLAALAAGPSRDEQRLGLTSALPPNQVASARRTRDTAEVDLRASFADVRSRDQMFAIGQLVFTITERPGIGRVVFTLAGDSIEIPRGDGSLTTDPLTRDDYEQIAPR